MTKRALLRLLAVLLVGTPLAASATCNTGGGTIDIYGGGYRHRDEIVDIPLWPFDERLVIYDEDDYGCYNCW